MNTTDTTPTTETRYCLHGCGLPVKGNYLPGHDSKHVAWVLEDIRLGNLSVRSALDSMPTPGMYNKLVRSLRNRGYRYNSVTRDWTLPKRKQQEAESE